MNVSAVRQFLLLAVLLFGVGCAPSDDILSNEQLAVSKLEERVAGRWKALIDGNISLAYSYLSPSYRRLHNEEAYRSSIGGSVNWISAKILHLDYNRKDAPDVAGVEIELSYRLNLPGNQGEDFSRSVGVIQSESSEKWVVVDNNWWFSRSGSTGL